MDWWFLSFPRRHPTPCHIRPQPCPSAVVRERTAVAPTSAPTAECVVPTACFFAAAYRRWHPRVLLIAIGAARRSSASIPRCCLGTAMQEEQPLAHMRTRFCQLMARWRSTRAA